MSAFTALTQSESNEWYTPPPIIEAARWVMNGIEFDPASNATAQQWIQAERWVGLPQDAMQMPGWICRSLWLNPPYGQRNLAKGNYGAGAWLHRAVDEYERCHIDEAIILCRGDSTGVKRLQSQFIQCICDRVAFISPDHPNACNPVPGTRIFGLGVHPDRFAHEFKAFGTIVVPYGFEE